MFRKKHKHRFSFVCKDQQRKGNCTSIWVCAWERTGLHACDQTILSQYLQTGSTLVGLPVVDELVGLWDIWYFFHSEPLKASYHGLHSCWKKIYIFEEKLY